MVSNHSDPRQYPDPPERPDRPNRPGRANRLRFNLPATPSENTHDSTPTNPKYDGQTFGKIIPRGMTSGVGDAFASKSVPKGLPLGHTKSLSIAPIKPTTPIARSHDGDQFDTEQPPESLGQASAINSAKPTDTTPIEPPPGWMDPPALPNIPGSSGSPEISGTSKIHDGHKPVAPHTPALRLVGSHPDPRPSATREGASSRQPNVIRSRRPNPKANPARPAHSAGPSARLPLTQPAAASISASGVMLDLEPVGQPIASASDPRWVLALRTAESLQGTILPPEKRQQLIRLGKVMGMTAFDANLVIAIIQDQARRGYAADFCPTAGEGQLQMVPLPRLSAVRMSLPGRKALKLALAITCVLALEIIFFKLWLG